MLASDSQRSDITLYKNESGAVEVRFDAATLCCSLERMATLFDGELAVVAKQLKKLGSRVDSARATCSRPRTTNVLAGGAAA